MYSSISHFICKRWKCGILATLAFISAPSATNTNPFLDGVPYEFEALTDPNDYIVDRWEDPPNHSKDCYEKAFDSTPDAGQDSSFFFLFGTFSSCHFILLRILIKVDILIRNYNSYSVEEK